MNGNDDATRALVLTTIQLALVREGLGLLEAALTRDESDQIEQIQVILEQLDRIANREPPRGADT
jgi:hypothetical protein